MKKTYFLFCTLLALVALTFAACKDKDEPDEKVYPEKLTVAVDKVEYKDRIGEGTVYLTATMPEDCSEYYLAILPGTAGKNLPIDDTENMLTIFEQYGTLYDKDLKSEPIDDFGDFMLLDDCDYTILSLPFDAEGNKGVAERLNFTTPRRPLAGTPDINAEVLESAPFYFVTRFTPNDDCKEIAICIFEKGTAEQQFEMYGAMMGLYSMKHMVDQFSGPRISGASTDTVPRSKDLIPNTEYELYVLTVDKNGVYGDMKIFPMTTAILGGSGEAKCTIEIGEGSYSADNGVCQMVTVTPNDQAGMYHYILIDKDTFDLPKWQESGVTEYLKATQEGNPYWDLYTTDVWNWPNLTPGATYYVFAMAQNADKVWGPLVKAEFTAITTPDGNTMTVSPVAPQSYYNGYYPTYGSYNFIPTFVGGDIIAGAEGYEGGDGYIFHIDINSASDDGMKPASGTYTIEASRRAGTCTPGRAMNAGMMMLLEGCCGLVRENRQIVDTIYFTSGTVVIDGDNYTMTLKSDEYSEPFRLTNTQPVTFRDVSN